MKAPVQIILGGPSQPSVHYLTSAWLLKHLLQRFHDCPANIVIQDDPKKSFEVIIFDDTDIVLEAIRSLFKDVFIVIAHGHDSKLGDFKRIAVAGDPSTLIHEYWVLLKLNLETSYLSLSDLPLALQAIYNGYQTRRPMDYPGDFMIYVHSLNRNERNWNLLMAMNQHGINRALSTSESLIRFATSQHITCTQLYKG